MTDPRIKQYHVHNYRSLAYMIAMIIAIILLSMYSITITVMDLSFNECIEIVKRCLDGVQPTSFIERLENTLVYEENIPRTCTAIIAGATLATCGAALQSLIKNPLADPYTLGISSGAMFGMVISVAFGVSILPFFGNDIASISNAFFMSLIPTFVVILVSIFKKMTPTMMILCGLGVMYLFNSCTTVIKYNVPPETLSQIYQWSIGSAACTRIPAIPILIAGFLLAFIPLFILSRRIDIVAQGDQNAMSLGIVPNRLRIGCLMICSLATATIVCYTGTIGFVGLVAPHIARILVGSNNRILIPASAVIGALMTLSADIIVHKFFSGIPVGAMLALVCSPIFIYILLRLRKNPW